MNQKIFDTRCLSEMSAESFASLSIVEKHVQALVKGDVAAQLQVLSNEVTIDYRGRYGLGRKELAKQDAIQFHNELRKQVEVIAFNVVKVYGDGNTVFILGNTTEKTVLTGITNEDKCIWIYTLHEGLISKIEFLDESHALFAFFMEIMKSNIR